MPTKKILRILAYIFIPLIPLAIAVYFLFPYLNEEKYEEVSEKYSDKIKIGDTTNVAGPSSLNGQKDSAMKDIGKNYSNLKEETSQSQQDIKRLNREVDSLVSINDSLKQQLARRPLPETDKTVGTETSDKKFSENIKSLLDLDTEVLKPILSKMSEEKLKRIFKVGSGLQRKKLLRSLKSDRAAKLMTEVL